MRYQILGVILPVCIIALTTNKTIIASMSSSIAAPGTNLASLICVLFAFFPTLLGLVRSLDISIFIAVRD